MAAQGNKTCQVCFANQPTHFCDCQDPPTLFCLECSSRHSSQNPTIIHQIFPISALERNIKDYERKRKALYEAANELRKNVERIDQCSREIEEMVKWCANSLTEYGSRWVHHLTTEKEGLSAAIEAAVLETTHCLNQNTEPHSPLAWVLWTSLPKEMQVVSYSVTTPDLQTILQTCLSYQNNLQALCSKPVEEAKRDSVASISSAHIPPSAEEAKSAPAIPPKATCAVQSEEAGISSKDKGTELAQVTSTFLCFFHFQTSAWGPQVQLRTQIQADEQSRWVMLEGCVFCCGGYHIAAVFILARDGAVEQKADMSVERWSHGLQAVCSAVYVFGGTGEGRIFKTCAKWEENQWTQLPSMREGRRYFNPCMLEGRLYLCGGEVSNTIEAFAPQTDTFLPLLVTLPEKSDCCLYVDDHLLVVHSVNYILKFAVEPDGQLAKRSAVTSAPFCKHQSSQPAVDKEKGVFYMVQYGECVCIAMETGVHNL